MDVLLKECEKRKDNLKVLESGVVALQSNQRHKINRAAKNDCNEKEQIKFIFNKPLERNYEEKL
jgi:hypothetical protein